MKVSLRSIAESLQAELVGDGAVEVSGIASIARATPADLVFVEDEKHLRLALESRAAAVIAGKFAGGKAHFKTSADFTPTQTDICAGGTTALLRARTVRQAIACQRSGACFGPAG